MVCPIGSGRMAALARLLTSGNISKSTADDFCRRKLAVQYIHRELQEANEANLIDEQDMHIFDLQPMTDPLHLVSCNACRKPIKASQYAVHAELCTSLTPLEEIGLELDGNTWHKKPPRKERRKLPMVHSNQATSVGERLKFEHRDSSGTSASESQPENPSAEAKNGPFILDCSEISPGNTSSLATTIPRPRKRSKVATTEASPPALDNFVPASGVTSRETISHGEYPRSSETVGEKVVDDAVGQKMHRQFNELHRPNKVILDVPVPLATKIYYSQRNNRLRSALGHLYHNAQTKEYSSGFVPEKALQANVVTTLTSSSNSFSLDQISDDQLDKEGDPPTYAPDQILAQSSELYSCRTGGIPPGMSISNQFTVNNVLRPHTSLGKMSSNYFSNSYSFVDSSGSAGCSHGKNLLVPPKKIKERDGGGVEDVFKKIRCHYT